MAGDLTILNVLQKHGVPFILIGGHAVNFHGYQRTTEDVDIVWMRSEERESALLAALTELGAQYIGNEIDPATRIERTYPVTIQYIRSSPLMMVHTSHGFLDLFDYLPGDPTADLSAFFASSVESGGVRIASLEWLRRMKRTAGRTKDILDLENLPE